MTSRELVPVLIVPFIAWRVYRRVRRSVGRQPFRPVGLAVRIVVFGAILAAVAWAGSSHPETLASLGGGLLLGSGLAIYGLTLTKFESAPDGRFYTPNTALGVSISVLFVGRIVYRMLVLTDASALPTRAFPAPFQSPLTLFLFGLTAGYYIAYYAGVLIRSRQTS
ncbi:MAG TPA: hypothetical protein VG734_15790 [Lacunisphaera sp.]|nr:hypothetical protein [Lacunisphaera sp.]